MDLSDQNKKNRISLFAKHAVKYYIVGACGVLVNLGLLYSLTEFVGLWYLVSYIIAISVSITLNFTFNKFWTFKDSKNSQRKIVIYLKFVGVSLLGMGIQLGSVYLLVERSSLNAPSTLSIMDGRLVASVFSVLSVRLSAISGAGNGGGE